MKIIVIPDNLNDNQANVYEGPDSDVKDLLDDFVAGNGKEVDKVWPPKPGNEVYKIEHDFTGKPGKSPKILSITISQSNPTCYQIGSFLWCG